MAKKEVIQFAQKMETDAELRSKVESVAGSTKEERLAALARVANDAGFEISPAELEAGYGQLAAGELGEEALGAVTGGATATAINSAFVSMYSTLFSGFGLKSINCNEIGCNERSLLCDGMIPR